jgi:hypothetical protein
MTNIDENSDSKTNPCQAQKDHFCVQSCYQSDCKANQSLHTPGFFYEFSKTIIFQQLQRLLTVFNAIQTFPGTQQPT